jgi:hypothetical protein
MNTYLTASDQTLPITCPKDCIGAVEEPKSSVSPEPGTLFDGGVDHTDSPDVENPQISDASDQHAAAVNASSQTLSACPEDFIGAPEEPKSVFPEPDTTSFDRDVDHSNSPDVENHQIPDTSDHMQLDTSDDAVTMNGISVPLHGSDDDTTAPDLRGVSPITADAGRDATLSEEDPAVLHVPSDIPDDCPGALEIGTSVSSHDVASSIGDGGLKGDLNTPDKLSAPLEESSPVLGTDPPTLSTEEQVRGDHVSQCTGNDETPAADAMSCLESLPYEAIKNTDGKTEVDDSNVLVVGSRFVPDGTAGHSNLVNNNGQLNVIDLTGDDDDAPAPTTRRSRRRTTCRTKAPNRFSISVINPATNGEVTDLTGDDEDVPKKIKMGPMGDIAPTRVRVGSKRARSACEVAGKHRRKWRKISPGYPETGR